MRLGFDGQPRQQVFQLQARVLSSLDRTAAERSQRVFDQAFVAGIGGYSPMLPTRPKSNWRAAKSVSARQDLQNVFQTAAFAFDVGMERQCIAPTFGSFQQFMLCSRESVRLFDVRIGPPWWVRDKAFLEMMYTAIMAQEEPIDEEMQGLLECYWGECGDTPQWAGESYFRFENAMSAGVIEQCRWHYYESDGKTVKPGFDPLEAELSLLLNWQAMYQPRFAIDGRDIQGSYRARTAHPHRAEERRLIRLLNLTPRGRPQKASNAAHA